MKGISDKKESSLIDVKKLIVEFIGTFTLTYVGSWAIIYSDLNSVTRNGVALCHAFVLTGFIWFGVGISGAHYNPALTLAMVIVKRIDWTSALFYIISQFLGALIGAGFIFIQLNADILDKIKEKSIMGIPRPGSSSYEVSGMWGEVLGTFFLTYVYMATCADTNNRKVAGIGGPAVGFTLYLVIMTVGELSGGGLNPARSLGPAIVAGHIDREQFVHLIGPIIGAALGAILFTSVFIDDAEDIAEAAKEKARQSGRNDTYEETEGVELQ